MPDMLKKETVHYESRDLLTLWLLDQYDHEDSRVSVRDCRVRAYRYPHESS